MTTYIIGHQKPDTDSVVSALALEFLFTQKECFGHKNPKAVVADSLNPETKYLFDKLNQRHPPLLESSSIQPDDTFVLVDHNEADQRLEGINSNQIVEIIDHHKINLNLGKPIYLNFKPWGSSSTIVYYLMKYASQSQVKPDKTLATLMLAAILSDTVGFKSPTSTKRDEKFAAELAELAQVDDLDAFTLEIFKAKSNIKNLTDNQIVKNDYKIFDFTKKTFINQLETVEQQDIIDNKKSDLLNALKETKQSESVDLAFMAITDVLKVNTRLLILGAEEGNVAEKAFGGKVTDNLLDIGPKLSRKKEIAPAIEQALKDN